MAQTPYSALPPSAFWKTGVAQENPFAMEDIYQKKYDIPHAAKIATAGSCFAQHISFHLKKNGYKVIDVEPAPLTLAESDHHKHGYSMYSARYGNIYTVRQLLQLAQEALGDWSPVNYIWKKNGRFYDALRPAIEPDGHESPEDVIQSREDHIAKVRELFETLDVFIFTLGLTEMWVHKESGTVYPTAPGAVVGEYDGDMYEFKNAQFGEVLSDFNDFQKALLKIRGGKRFHILLTVSPVPLTASASGLHVLVSTSFSKAILRAVAGQLVSNQPHIDYFPSFEIVTNPRLHSSSYTHNLRSVRDEAVANVMSHFFAVHNPVQEMMSVQDLHHDNSVVNADIQCEEALLEAFAEPFHHSPRHTDHAVSYHEYYEVFGNSHLAGFKAACRSLEVAMSNLYFYPVNWLLRTWVQRDFSVCAQRSEFDVSHQELLQMPPQNSSRSGLIFVGMGLMGEGIINCFGKLRAGFTNADGTLPLGAEISPNLPIVSSADQVSAEVINSFVSQVADIRTVIEKIVGHLSVKTFQWIGSPLPSEACACYRFGTSYVASNSQSIYNRIYLEVVHDLLSVYLDAGILILQDPSTVAPSGFTRDEFRADEPIYGIHASPSYYRSALQSLKL